MAILTNDKLDFKTRMARRDEESQCLLIKRTILQEEIALLNMNGPKIAALVFIKQTLHMRHGKTDRPI